MKRGFEGKYESYKTMLKDERLPLAFVDLEAFDRNVAYVAKTQEKTGKTIRVASKSIRCIELIRRVFEKGGSAYKGILAFTMEEAAFLFDNGFDNIIVAYPTVRQTDLDLFVEKTQQGADIFLMADSMEHLEALSRAGEAADISLKVCLDVDMSYRPFGNLHLGVRRSPLHTADQAAALVKKAKALPGIRIAGLMGYEAQIASLNDNYPGARIKNRFLRAFKRWSSTELINRRGGIVDTVRQLGVELEVVNGGGSGSLISTGMDSSVTEVTAGSAFFAPGLFRYFNEVAFEPAAFFALQVARIPKPSMVTCQGGGYVASGEVGDNKLPWPVMPQGLSYLPVEGAGEVQTPLALPAEAPPIAVGDPIFFQHAKAGELCERFNDLLLIQNGQINERVPTYRGQGKAFL